ncbi:MAG: metallophosphoesterase [Melioribacteraceae bacterium]|nr:metallophosphoesterase [Melioribacteraceae bacterium]
MRNNPFLVLFIFTAFFLLIDIYAYRGIKKLKINYKEKTQKIIRYLFWIVPLILIVELLLFSIFYTHIDPANYIIYFHFISGTFILFYVPKLLFIFFNMLDDLVLLVKKVFRNKGTNYSDTEISGKPISRGQFINRTGMILAAIPFLSIAYGIKWGRFNFTIRNQSLKFKNLPAALNGLKIVQISDLHIGSFVDNKEHIKDAVELINKQNPDIILFTGDFVNNVASEIDEFVDVLSMMKAKYGMYSVLGNHDYGEYVPWNSLEDKQNNINRIIDLQRKIGFNVLMNESRTIKINDGELELVGIENWGLPPFPQYGDLNKALSTVKKDSFKVLLSHDPTHWDAQVLEKTDIDFTLSGHTHGAQFGIEIPGVRWSPVTIRYKRWGGLYSEADQKLFVSTGIGFIGFPGRVGMPPEIAVFELKKS